MKKIILQSAAVFLLLHLTPSCSKESGTAGQIDEEKISEVKKLATDPVNGILAYRLLSSSEKAKVWTDRLSGFIRTGNYNRTQIALIEKTLELITPELFNKAAKSKYFESVKELEYDVSKNFTPQQAAEIFGSIVIPIKDENNSGINLSVGAPCTCRWSTVCQLMNEHAICEWGWASCQETEDGCGFLFLYACKGKCVIYNPPN